MSMSKGVEIILPLSACPPMPSASSSSPTKGQHKPNVLRKELTVFIGEFIGTFMFLFLAFAGTQIALESTTVNPFTPPNVNPPPEVAKLIYIAFSFGAGLAVNVAIFADVSGGMFNPAVSHLSLTHSVHSDF